MTISYWLLILTLAIAAFTIRVLGLFAGDAIKSSRFNWVLDELPGLIVVSLVASSLTGQPVGTWVAAGVALAVAYFTNHVILTMFLGVTAFGLLLWLGV